MSMTLREIHRVLKPAGRARFIVHHKRSLLVGNGQLSLRHSDMDLKETKIYRLLRRYLEAERRSKAAARNTRQELNRAAHYLQARLDEAGGSLVISVTLGAVQKLLNARTQLGPAAALGREIDRAENELRASVRRLHDLVDHAQRDADVAAIEAIAFSVGFSVLERVEQYHAGANLVGWRLTLQRH